VGSTQHRTWRHPETVLKAMVIAVTALLILLVGALVLLVRGSGGQSAPPPPVEVGAPAPELDAEMLDGTPVTLSGLRGRPVWLNFWATWCAPCKAEMPELVSVGKEAKASGIRLIAVDVGESRGTVQSFLETAGYAELPAAIDRDGRTNASYRVYGLPTHVFIDSTGIVRRAEVGPMSATEMRDAVRSLR